MNVGNLVYKIMDYVPNKLYDFLDRLEHGKGGHLKKSVREELREEGGFTDIFLEYVTENPRILAAARVVMDEEGISKQFNVALTDYEKAKATQPSLREIITKTI